VLKIAEILVQQGGWKKGVRFSVPKVKDIHDHDKLLSGQYWMELVDSTIEID